MADTPAEPEPPRRKARHTWPQRAVLIVNSVIVVGCLLAAALIFYGNARLGDRKVVALDHPSTTAASPPASEAGGSDAVPDDSPNSTADEWTEPYTGDTSAKNFLITGQSSEPCVDPDDPTAGGFGAGNTSGHLTDSIMVMRISPATNQAAVLSFPRDLWVKIHGRNGSSRINSAYNPTDPNRLAGTITDNFDIPIDHYININLCSFKKIVDAVGGVKVPFEYAVYDRNVGLDIPAPGCVELNGNQALAWVRTRKLWYIDPTTGDAKQDPTSDFGRISRQQDFLRRLATKAISSGLTNPRAATTFLNTYIDQVTTDTDLTPGKMLDFVSAMRNIDPSAIRTYQVETVSEPHNGLSTLGLKNSDFNDQVLDVFRGVADLATISTGPPTTSADTAATTTATTTTIADGGPGSATIPTVDPQSNPTGIVPPDDPTCH